MVHIEIEVIDGKLMVNGADIGLVHNKKQPCTIKYQ